ncbi:MAG: inositol monophosphatase family protein [Campylobacterota bacterium]|nr:inositol monophosphatase family protein [Campylobacterota bacterium]
MKEPLIDIIKSASLIFKEGYFSTKNVDFKAKKDMVTQYDVAVENYLKAKLSLAFPTFNIIAEESNNEQSVFGDSIIIDPIDGTTNFVNGVPHCAISVGVYKDQQPFMGVVYNPILEELFFAQVECGAFLNEEPIHVSQESNFQKALLATGFPYSGATNQDDLNIVINNLHKILPACQDIRRFGSAALDLCYVAKGMFEGYYEINLQAWDVSAGVIILKEAGGKVSNQHGEKHHIFNDKYMLASNGLIHQKLVDMVE